ncbi:DUF1524 domain-containing protein [Aquiluna sp. KACHI24]|uniref:GmrSD restriction endonuclease domain-containing protein n=1 Tax=Aquiluna sp. KACHI24 TaxID=2968831 RepID=UPI00222F16A9|nr:DUF1524 domain-containing protein [Aquiluna sp. KACHI24]
MKPIALALAALLLSGCSITPAPTPPTSTKPQQTKTSNPSPSSTEPTVVTSSQTVSQAGEPGSENTLELLLSELTIQDEFTSGYDRDLFQHWIDADSDGCNTRREVLIIESVIEPGVSGNCQVSGRWVSVYDNRSIADASDLDIDHLVPLAEAWRSGAHAWDSNTRKRFANDLGFPGSLIAVTAASNRAKSDKDPASWLPYNQNYQCQYAFDWMAVKYRWSLSIDSQEALALAEIVPECDIDNELPNKAEVTKGSPITQKPSKGELDPRFDTCKAAIAAGFGPYVSGVDPEYDWYRDGDSDGTVCE